MKTRLYGWMRKCLPVLLVLAFSATVYANTYSTTFPLVENPISESGQWTNGGTTVSTGTT